MDYSLTKQQVKILLRLYKSKYPKYVLDDKYFRDALFNVPFDDLEKYGFIEETEKFKYRLTIKGTSYAEEIIRERNTKRLGLIISVIPIVISLASLVVAIISLIFSSN